MCGKNCNVTLPCGIIISRNKEECCFNKEDRELIVTHVKLLGTKNLSFVANFLISLDTHRKLLDLYTFALHFQSKYLTLSSNGVLFGS